MKLDDQNSQLHVILMRLMITCVQYTPSVCLLSVTNHLHETKFITQSSGFPWYPRLGLQSV